MKSHRIGENGKKVNGKKAAGILFTDGKSVLMLKRAGEGDHIDTWALPGGKSHDGESDIGTAIRETKEETGLTSIPGHRFCNLTSHDGMKTFTTYLYRISKKFDVKISDEHSEWKWMPLDSIQEEKLHPKFRDTLPRYLKAIRHKICNFTEWSVFTESTNYNVVR